MSDHAIVEPARRRSPRETASVTNRGRKPSSQLDAIQALRALAAVLVFTHHLLLEILVQNASPAPTLLALYPVALGGVHLFFVISGYLIVYATRNTFGAPRASFEFMYRRVARIAPLYILFTALFVFAAVAAGSLVNNNQISATDMIRSLLFIPYPGVEGNFHPVFGVGWTINYDMFLYVVFAPFLFLERSVALPAFCATVLCLFGAGVFLAPEHGAAWFWTRPIILEMLAGAALGWTFVEGKFKLSRPICRTLLAAGVAWWLFAWGGAPATVDELHRYDSQFAYLQRGVPSVLILAGLTLTPNAERSPLRETPFGRALLAVGDRSYSLSMSHMFMLRALTIVLPAGLLGSSYVPAYLGAAMLLIVPTTLLTYQVLERPIDRLTRPARRPTT